MKQRRFSEEQTVASLRERAAGGGTIGEPCRRHGISKPMFYAWRKKFERRRGVAASMPQSDVTRRRELEEEHRRLKRLLGRAGLRGGCDDGSRPQQIVGARARRRVAQIMVSREVSARRACELVGTSRRWTGYPSQAKDHGLVGRLIALALEHQRYGYRRLWALPPAAG